MSLINRLNLLTFLLQVWFRKLFKSFHKSFCSQGGGSASAHAGIPSPRTRHPPQDQTPSWDHAPPGTMHPPPARQDQGVGSTRGRYASCWNAILLKLNILYFSDAYVGNEYYSQILCLNLLFFADKEPRKLPLLVLV